MICMFQGVVCYGVGNIVTIFTAGSLWSRLGKYTGLCFWAVFCGCTDGSLLILDLSHHALLLSDNDQQLYRLMHICIYVHTMIHIHECMYMDICIIKSIIMIRYATCTHTRVCMHARYVHMYIWTYVCTHACIYY